MVAGTARGAVPKNWGGMDGTASLARNVAIFLDMENLYVGHRNEVGAVPLGRLVREIEQIVRAGGFGRRTTTMRAYANWGNPEMGGYRRETMEHGFKAVQTFSFDKKVKNAAHIELCVDVLQVAQESPWVEVFVIATGDGGFIPLMRRLHGLNKYVVVVSTSAPAAGLVNSMLNSVADEYLQIDVLPAGAATVAPKVSAKTVAAKPVAVKVKAKVKTDVAQVLPTAQDLRSTIINLSKQNPVIMIDGPVNASDLGQTLRKTWPNIKYTNYDTKTLSGFVEKHCGLGARNADPKKTVAATAPELQSV